jgi:hypothetical protein
VGTTVTALATLSRRDIADASASARDNRLGTECLGDYNGVSASSAGATATSTAGGPSTAQRSTATGRRSSTVNGPQRPRRAAAAPPALATATSSLPRRSQWLAERVAGDQAHPGTARRTRRQLPGHPLRGTRRLSLVTPALMSAANVETFQSNYHGANPVLETIRTDLSLLDERAAAMAELEQKLSRPSRPPDGPR